MLGLALESKEQEIKALGNKLSEIRKIESESWSVLEKCEESKEKIEKYEIFMNEFVANLSAFKVG